MKSLSRGCLSCVDLTYKNRLLSSLISCHPHPALSVPRWKWSLLHKGSGRDRPGSDSTPQPSSPSLASSCFLGKACSLGYGCCLVDQSCPTLCDPMDCSTPGFSVLHYLPEFVQTHVHQVGDAILTSHPLSSPSPPAFNLSQHQGLFQ